MSRKVLGYCSIHSSAFAFVLAEANDDGSLKPIAHPVAAFPPQGPSRIVWRSCSQPT
jgi:hypothetical protein